MTAKTWDAYDDENSDEADCFQVEAENAEDAAEEAAEKLDPLAGEFAKERTIMVREAGTDGWRKFRVTAEVTVQYWATEEEQQEDDE